MRRDMGSDDLAQLGSLTVLVCLEGAVDVDSHPVGG